MSSEDNGQDPGVCCRVGCCHLMKETWFHLKPHGARESGVSGDSVVGLFDFATLLGSYTSTSFPALIQP